MAKKPTPTKLQKSPIVPIKHVSYTPAKVDHVYLRNMHNTHVILQSEDTDHMILPPGVHKVMSKFTWVLPQGVMLHNSRQPVKSVNIDTPTAVAATTNANANVTPSNANVTPSAPDVKSSPALVVGASNYVNTTK